MITVSSKTKKLLLIVKISPYNLCLLRPTMITPPKELFDCTQNLSEPYKCHLCGFKSDLLVRFRQHSLHKTKTHTCTKCDFKTHSYLVLMRHTNKECKRTELALRTCSKSRPRFQWFQCDQCVYASTQKGALKAHVLARHTPEEAISWFHCDQCAYRAKQKGDLRKHIQRIHVREVIDDKRFQCDKCPFRTKRRPCLKKHLLVMHNGVARLMREGVRFRCTQCSYGSNRVDNLKKHVVEKHTPPEEIAWFECGQCSYKAKRVSRLKEHVLMRHTALENIKWFECEQCSYKGKLKTNLRSHILAKHLSIQEVK